MEQPAQQIASVVRVVTKADAFVKLAQEQATLAQLLRRFKLAAQLRSLRLIDAVIQRLGIHHVDGDAVIIAPPRPSAIRP